MNKLLVLSLISGGPQLIGTNNEDNKYEGVTISCGPP